nr:LTA synthase family protein [Litorivivens lipolytica]
MSYLGKHFLYAILAFSVIAGFSYFGALNPHPSGLLSSLHILFGSLILLLLASFISFKVYATVLISLCIFSLSLTVSNWWYFQYFQTYFNYEVLALAFESLDSFRSFSTFESKTSAVTLALASFLLALLSVFNYKKIEFPSKSANIGVVFLLFAFVTSGAILSKSFNHYRQLSMFTLAPSYVSPIHAFFVSSQSTSPRGTEGQSKAELLFESLNRVSIDDGDFEADKPTTRNNFNVVVIAIESMRASLLGMYGTLPSVTPALDKFGEQNISVRNFYANTNFTVKGETAIWCGIFDQSVKPPYSKFSSEIKNLRCLPEILAENGYDTLYFHGNSGRFYSRNEYLPIVGFDTLEFFDSDRRALLNMPEIGWGASDESIYKYMLEELKKRDGGSPFFAHFTTITSHYPFHWDWGVDTPNFIDQLDESTLYKNYLKSASYNDYAFSQFLKAFQESPLVENTILVVTADHGIWYFPESLQSSSIVKRNETFFRMPLFIYHPDIVGGVEIDQVSSQIDIPPTLLGLLGMDQYKDQFIGKDMMRPVAKPWAVMMKSGELTIRVGEQLCSMSVEDCSGAHQECAAKNYGEIFLEDVSDLEYCERVKGDILLGGVVEPVESQKGWLAAGLDLVASHNARVFGGPESGRVDLE